MWSENFTAKFINPPIETLSTDANRYPLKLQKNFHKKLEFDEVSLNSSKQVNISMQCRPRWHFPKLDRPHQGQEIPEIYLEDDRTISVILCYS